MKPLNKTGLLIIIPLFLICTSVTGQGRKAAKAIKHAEKVKIEQKKSYNKARKKEVNRRFEIQSDATKEQMKESHQRAKNYNTKKKDPFLRRIFKGKKSYKQKR